MDAAGSAFSAFGGLPGFDPMMMINRSGTCATSKLLQCRSFGVYACDIAAKFNGSPQAAPDLSAGDFLARKDVVSQVQQWVEANAQENRREEWVPILYLYEVARSSAKRQRDWGHLVFTDLTTTRFLLVMCFGAPSCACGNPYHHDYDVLTKFHADRLMSLVTYLYHKENKPAWVRATYTTSTSKELPSGFSSFSDTAPESTQQTPIFHVTPETFTPSLLESELEKIDNLLAGTRSGSAPPPELRARLLGGKEGRPTPQAWTQGMEKNARQCAFCEKIGPQTMPTCSRCKLVRYCDKNCQKAAWPMHKPVCKTAK